LLADPRSPRPSINQLGKLHRAGPGMLGWSLGPHWQAGVSPPLLPSAGGDDYAAARRPERLAGAASGSVRAGSCPDRLPWPLKLGQRFRSSGKRSEHLLVQLAARPSESASPHGIPWRSHGSSEGFPNRRSPDQPIQPSTDHSPLTGTSDASRLITADVVGSEHQQDT
jgi:hypothetical protein